MGLNEWHVLPHYLIIYFNYCARDSLDNSGSYLEVLIFRHLDDRWVALSSYTLGRIRVAWFTNSRWWGWYIFGQRYQCIFWLKWNLIDVHSQELGLYISLSCCSNFLLHCPGVYKSSLRNVWNTTRSLLIHQKAYGLEFHPTLLDSAILALGNVQHH